MPVIDNVTSLKASPLRVWLVLTDFARHPQWRPFIQLSGAAIPGGAANYTFRIGGRDRPVTAKADITRIDKPFVFAWATGIANILLFEEAYALEREPTGARLRHSLRLSGLLGGLLMTMMRPRLKASLIRSDQCLERHLRRLSSQQTPKEWNLHSNHSAKSQRRSR